MNDVKLIKFDNSYLNLIIKWLNKDYITKCYGDLNEWIIEVENKDNEFDFIRHFVVFHKEKPIGFCQYYDCYYASENWYTINKETEVFSIDYLIGEEEYLYKGFGKEIVKLLIQKIKTISSSKLIIVDPEKENVNSTNVLINNGFIYCSKLKYYVYEIKKIEELSNLSIKELWYLFPIKLFAHNILWSANYKEECDYLKKA